MLEPHHGGHLSARVNWRCPTSSARLLALASTPRCTRFAALLSRQLRYRLLSEPPSLLRGRKMSPLLRLSPPDRFIALRGLSRTGIRGRTTRGRGDS